MVEAGKESSGVQKAVSAWAQEVGLRHGRALMEGEPSPAPAQHSLAKALVYTTVPKRKVWERT